MGFKKGLFVVGVNESDTIKLKLTERNEKIKKILD